MSQTLNRSLAPLVVSVATGSPAESVGVLPGDEIVRVNGEVPRDIIEWQMATDEADVELDVRRGGLDLSMIDREGGGRVARHRGVERRVRPGPHVRQPL